jgi:hypothetical protein
MPLFLRAAHHLDIPKQIVIRVIRLGLSQPRAGLVSTGDPRPAPVVSVTQELAGLAGLLATRILSAADITAAMSAAYADLAAVEPEPITVPR